MQDSRLTILALVAALLAFAAAEADLGRPEGAWAQTEDMEVVDPAEVEPFARVREVEAIGGGSGVATSHRADGYLEEIYFNSPLYRGDRLETDEHNRAEIQFPDGSVVRLDTDTLVEVVSMRDPSGRFSGSNLLAVHMGRVQVELVETESERDLFRVDTFACSVYPLDRAAFRVDVVDSRAVLVRVAAGSVEVVGEQDAVNLQAGEMTEAHGGAPLGRPRPYNLLSRDHFGRWIESRDLAYALEAPPGEEYAELPEEVQPYYGELSGAGRWVWTEEYGQTWVPAVTPEWRPYYDGYWAYGPWGPTWVGYEPWGWVTYRYGRWNYLIDVGWAWVPGRVWSTAWVSWHYGSASVGWAPLGFHGGPWFWHDPWGYPVGGGFHWSHHWHSYSTWNVVSYDEFYYRRVDRVAVRYKDPLPGRGGGVVARRAVHTRRGESLRDGVARVRSGGRSLDPVAPPGASAQRRRAERSFLDDERRVLTPGRGRSSSAERAARSERRVPGDPGAGDAGRRGSQGESARRLAGGERGSRASGRSEAMLRRSGDGRSIDSGSRTYRTPTGRSGASQSARREAPERADPRSSGAGTARRSADSSRSSAARERGGTPSAGRSPGAERSRAQPGRTPSSGNAGSRERLRQLVREASGERSASTRRPGSSSGRSTPARGRSDSSRPGSSGSSSPRSSSSRRASPPPSRSRTSPGASSGRSSSTRGRSATGSRSGSASRPPAGRSGGSSSSRGGSRPSGTSSRSGGGSKPSASRSRSSGGSKPSASRSRSSGASKPSASRSRSTGGSKSSASRSRSSGSSKSSGGKSGSSGGSKGKSSARSRR